MVAPATHSAEPEPVEVATELLDLLVETLLLDLLELDEVTPVPLVGIEHSFTELVGAGSEPKVVTLQLKLPINTF
jgi:hypothetical protein